MIYDRRERSLLWLNIGFKYCDKSVNTYNILLALDYVGIFYFKVISVSEGLTLTSSYSATSYILSRFPGEIIDSTNNTKVEVKKLDLSSFSSVRAFAEDINNQSKSLTSSSTTLATQKPSERTNPRMILN